MNTNTLHIAKVIIPVLGLSAAIVSAEDIKSLQKQFDRLEDVTVSATRVDESLYYVPAAVGVVDSSDIGTGKQKIGLDESLVRIPGLFMQNRYNFAQSLKISIRGFGARANFGTRGIKLY